MHSALLLFDFASLFNGLRYIRKIFLCREMLFVNNSKIKFTDFNKVFSMIFAFCKCFRSIAWFYSKCQ